MVFAGSILSYSIIPNCCPWRSLSGVRTGHLYLNQERSPSRAELTLALLQDSVEFGRIVTFYPQYFHPILLRSWVYSSCFLTVVVLGSKVPMPLLNVQKLYQESLKREVTELWRENRGSPPMAMAMATAQWGNYPGDITEMTEYLLDWWQWRTFCIFSLFWIWKMKVSSSSQ